MNLWLGKEGEWGSTLNFTTASLPSCAEFIHTCINNADDWDETPNANEFTVLSVGGCTDLRQHVVFSSTVCNQYNKTYRFNYPSDRSHTLSSVTKILTYLQIHQTRRFLHARLRFRLHIRADWKQCDRDDIKNSIVQVSYRRQHRCIGFGKSGQS